MPPRLRLDRVEFVGVCLNPKCKREDVRQPLPGKPWNIPHCECGGELKVYDVRPKKAA